MRTAVRTFLPLVDLALLLSTVFALAVMLTGGGEVELDAIRLSALRARNPLTLALALAVLRLVLHNSGPFLGMRALDMEGLPAVAARRAAGLWRRLQTLTPSMALRALLVLLLVSLLLRLANAWYYYGFSSGDDVEVHEMTFSVLFGEDFSIWNLRSPFFPMTFLYPVQRLALALGGDGTGILVFVGRVVVAVWSCVGLALTYFIGRRLLGSPGAGLLASLLLAVMRLHVRFGSSELPRPVAATFLLMGFGLLVARPRSAGYASLAGVVIGMAAAMRFSEVVFLLPVTALLLAERRLRDLLVVTAVAGATAGAIIGLGDLAYWGQAFQSLRHVVDFTLVQQASSRGVQPFHHYLTTAPVWSNVCMLVFFAAGIKPGWRSALWVLLPIAALSVLPHKEERYLVPLMPFFALTAAAGVLGLLESVRSGRRERWAPYVLLFLAGAVALELEGARFRRSEGTVDVARHLARSSPETSVAIEQAWRAGSRLYLRNARIVDLEPGRLDEATYLWGVLRASDVRFVVLRSQRLERAWRRELLLRSGFREVPVSGPVRNPDVLFERPLGEPREQVP